MVATPPGFSENLSFEPGSRAPQALVLSRLNYGAVRINKG